jgi:hypothetical protein
MKKMIVVISAVLMMASSSYANTVSQDCGCGLGRELIGQKEGLVWNLLGTFLNGICGNQTFGMTSGTLGCNTGGKMVMNEQLEIFVADNRDNLAQDIASGKGETLSALAEITQISPDNQGRMFSALQSNFNAIYPDANVSDKHVVTVINDIVASI